jgi:hypothetical protein
MFIGMRPYFRPLMSFVAGCLTAAAAGTWIAELGAQSGGVRLVCVGEDGGLRLSASSPTCQAGQKSLYVFADFRGTQEDSSAAGVQASRERKLAELERQVTSLEKRTGPRDFRGTMVAPFTVVDRNNAPVFSVIDLNGATLVSTGPGDALALQARDDGGRMISGPVDAGLAAGDISFGFQSVEEREHGVRLGKSSTSGYYNLRFVGQNGQLLAGLGESSVGTGLAFVADKQGELRARMYIKSKTFHGALAIGHNENFFVTEMTEGDSGGGQLRLLNSTGVPMVEAAAYKDGYGVVAAGPRGFKSGYGVLGLPGSYIVGKAQ